MVTTVKIENRKTRFKRVATKRTNSVLEQLRILGNLSNKSYYDYSDEDINKIFRAIESQLKIVKTRFKRKKKTFKL